MRDSMESGLNGDRRQLPAPPALQAPGEVPVWERLRMSDDRFPVPLPRLEVTGLLSRTDMHPTLHPPSTKIARATPNRQGNPRIISSPPACSALEGRNGRGALRPGMS